MKNIFELYRFFSNKKVSSLRLILYVCFGLFLSQSFHFILFIIDIILVLSGILFASILNDYFDYQRYGEKNSIGRRLSAGKIGNAQLLIFIIVPGVFPLILFWVLYQLQISFIALIMLIASFAMSLLYCLPPFRFKEKAISGLLFPPVGIYLLFLQGVFIKGIPNSTALFIAINVFIFVWYVEFLHLADDAVTENELTKIKYDKSLNAANFVCCLGICFAIYALFSTIISVVFAVFWIMRQRAIYKIESATLSKARRSIFSTIYSIEEFPIIVIALILYNLFY